MDARVALRDAPPDTKRLMAPGPPSELEPRAGGVGERVDSSYYGSFFAGRQRVGRRLGFVPSVKLMAQMHFPGVRRRALSRRSESPSGRSWTMCSAAHAITPKTSSSSSTRSTAQDFSDYNMMVLKTILYTPPAPRPWPTEPGPWPTERASYPKSRRSHLKKKQAPPPQEVVARRRRRRVRRRRVAPQPRAVPPPRPPPPRRLQRRRVQEGGRRRGPRRLGWH